jgi:hypothetical protein
MLSCLRSDDLVNTHYNSYPIPEQEKHPSWPALSLKDVLIIDKNKKFL